MKLYTSDVFEDFLEDPKCGECGEPATQRCTACKNAWYCSRDCQLRQWKKHKAICKLITMNKEETQEEEKPKSKVTEEKKKKPLIQEM